MSKVYGVFYRGHGEFVIREGREDHRGMVTFTAPYHKRDAETILTTKGAAECYIFDQTTRDREHYRKRGEGAL